MNATTPDSADRRWRAWAAALLGAMLLLMFARAMRLTLNHDEHLFVASGALFARRGLLPYRDYLYIPVPNLVFLYAAVFMLTDHLLLAARSVSVVSGWLLLVLVFITAWGAHRGEVARERFILAAAATGLLFASPSFIYVNGRPWNNDASMLLAAAAFLLHCLAIRRGAPRVAFVVSGLLLGLAAGVRISFAPLALPFCIAIFLTATRRDWLARAGDLAAFALGGIVSVIPTVWLILKAPREFYFGNFTFRGLNAIYFHDVGSKHAMGVLGKLGYFFNDALFRRPTELLIVALAVVVLTGAARGLRRRSPRYVELVFFFMLLPFLFWGALAATPTQRQYYYPLIPFLILALVFALSQMPGGQSRERARVALVIVAVVASAVALVKDYRRVDVLANPSSWYPNRIHALGEAIRREIPQGDRPHGKVLTLAPIAPLEGGMDIDEELEVGPFAWRMAYLIDPATRRAQHVLGPGDLDAFLAANPPAAILTGFSGSLENPLIDFAKQHGYREVVFPFSNKLDPAEGAAPPVVLWVAR
jgi:hypothetical protein